jgi:hypothetical protein
MTKQILKINTNITNTFFNKINFPKVIDELICKFYNDNDCECQGHRCNHKDFLENLEECDFCVEGFCEDCIKECNGCDSNCCYGCDCDCIVCETCEDKYPEDDFRQILHFDGDVEMNCIHCIENHINVFTLKMTYERIQKLCWKYNYKDDNLFSKWDTDYNGNLCVKENRNLDYDPEDYEHSNMYGETIFEMDTREVNQKDFNNLKCIRCNRHQHNEHSDYEDCLDKDDELYHLDNEFDVVHTLSTEIEIGDKDFSVICDGCIDTSL